MSQVALHRFDVVPAFYRGHRIKVPLWHDKDFCNLCPAWPFPVHLHPLPIACGSMTLILTCTIQTAGAVWSKGKK